MNQEFTIRENLRSVSTKVYRLTISRAVTHSKSVHRISPGNWLWPRNRPFWMVAGKRIESSKILKSIHMSNSEFMGFQIGTQSWEVKKNWRIRTNDPMIWGLDDLMIKIVSRHRSKWPISRPNVSRNNYGNHSSGVRDRGLLVASCKWH